MVLTGGDCTEEFPPVAVMLFTKRGDAASQSGEISTIVCGFPQVINRNCSDSGWLSCHSKSYFLRRRRIIVIRPVNPVPSSTSGSVAGSGAVVGAVLVTSSTTW